MLTVMVDNTTPLVPRIRSNDPVTDPRSGKSNDGAVGSAGFCANHTSTCISCMDKPPKKPEILVKGLFMEKEKEPNFM